MTANDHISQEDLALEAMQTLSLAESARVRAHLDECGACRQSLTEFAEASALVGLSVPQQPLPQGARQRFLDRIADRNIDGANGAAPQQSSGAQIVTMPAPPTPTASATKANAKVVPIRQTSWMPWALAAALALVAVSLGFSNLALRNQLNKASSQLAASIQQTAQAQRVVDLLNSRAAQHVLLTASKPSAEPTGRAVYLAQTGSLLFQANNLKTIAADKTYELWIIPAEGNPIPAGLFRPDASGNASVVLPQLPVGVQAKAFGVTIEQATGSTTPTAPILLSGAAPSSGG
jgi:anti-sigma-K factor RskA